MIECQLLSYKDSKIAWYRFGTGAQPVFCFHGYGEDATSYAFLENVAGEQFSFYAIDLPYHGHTDWKENTPFTARDLVPIIDEIFNATNHDPKKINPQFILLGFSLGSRIALGLFETQPTRIEKLILLAPDGLKVNPWYWFATQTWLGHHFFLFTMKNPGWFRGFLGVLGKLKLVNASITRFVNHYTSDAAVRTLLYNRWMVLRKFSPVLIKIKTHILTNKTPVRLLYGRHDRIILPPPGQKFRKGIEAHCTLTMIATGHQVLNEKHADELMLALLR